MAKVPVLKVQLNVAGGLRGFLPWLVLVSI